MKKSLVLGFLASAVAGCGGGSGIGGDGAGSLYNLNVVLDTTHIDSKSVEVEQAVGANQEDILIITLPTDNIKGRVSLTYTGNSTNPLRGVVRSAELCILDQCYALPVAGVLVPGGQPLQIDMNINSHKVGLPWIAVNPMEDSVINTTFVDAALTGAVANFTQSSVYLNAQKTENLPNIPVAPNSVSITFTGQFNAQTTVASYSSPNVVNLDKGISTANAIIPNTVNVQVGANSYRDDGAGNIIDNAGNPVGTINYATGELRFTIAIANQTLTANYQVNGRLMCMDDGNGSIGQDCTGSINYSTGQLTYQFRFALANVPANVNITYGKAVGSGNTVSFNLPPRTSLRQYVYRVSGRVAEVYQGNTKLCDNQGQSNLCQISRDGETLRVQFNGTVPQNLTLRYSVDEVVDINPTIDARQYGGQWNGSSNPIVMGTVRVRVRLEDGSSLTATAPISFKIVP